MKLWIPNRGYSIECIDDSSIYDANQIKILGNYSKSGYNATAIVSVYEVAPTVQ